jgi:hypothetical protein
MPIRVERGAEPIADYRLLERLGGGGFGEVWKVEAPGGLLKAMKIVHGDLHTAGDEGQRAEQELKALNRVKTVRHPYILSLERVDIIEGRLLIVMELADRNLWDRFKECREQALPGIPREELLAYMRETAEALDLMNNDYQLQHLDIKPQNLFLVHNHIKVADFGMVKDLQGMATRVTGGVTPLYASPETFDGWVSRFSDQYSLAIVYQELLTGQRPFSATSVHQLIMLHLTKEPDLSTLPAEDRDAIGRALAKNPDHRHPSCRDLVRSLGHPGVAAAPPPSVPAGEVARPTPPGSGVLQRPESSSATAPVPRPARKPLPEPAGTPGRGSDAATPRAATPRFTEVTGGGELFPALVIGLGRAGLAGLRHLRAGLSDRFGAWDALPNVHLLYLDTDPTALQAAGLDTEPGKLHASEVLLARLNRPSYFLKPREGRPRLDTWLDTNLLYRIPRTQETGGLRALGRLAFFDNYRLIARRLRANLEACADPQALTTALQRTRLRFRRSQPRVYLLTSLAGGTGSAMVIDLAYTVRALLRQMGQPAPDVVGLLLLPQVDPEPTHRVALGNAFAALTELNHFASPETTFTARYDDRDAPLDDPDPPFSRCVLLSPPDAAGAGAELAARAGDFLLQDLATPLGRTADLQRTDVLAARSRPRGLVYQTFGLFRFAWPRQAVLHHAARRACVPVIQHWLAKDAKPLQDNVRAAVEEFWEAKQLGPEFVIARLQAACEKALGHAPEDVLADATAPFLTKARRGEFDPRALAELIGQLDQLLGSPSEFASVQRSGVLDEALRQQIEPVIREWERHLSTFTSRLIEDPAYRLAGTEEAFRQLINLIEHNLTHHEPLSQDLAGKIEQGHERLQFLLANLHEVARGGRKGAALAAELLEIIQFYPKWRYHSLVLRGTNYIFTSLRGYLSDQITDTSFYRVRLGELLRVLTGPGPYDRPESAEGVRHVYPPGCDTLEDVLELLFPGSTAAEIQEIDRRMQLMIQEHFVSLKQVSTNTANVVRKLAAAMVAEMVAYLGTRIAGDNVVEMYLNRHPDAAAALEGLTRAFNAAGPRVEDSDGPASGEVVIATVPNVPQAERFTDLVLEAQPSVKVVSTANPDEVVFYREESRHDLTDLEQLSPVGEDAYGQMVAAEHFPPHTRTDIHEWRPVITQ